MSVMASQITSLKFVYSSIYSGANQRKHQSFASLAFVRGIHRRPVNSPHKGPVTRKMFPFDDVIMNGLCETVGITTYKAVNLLRIQFCRVSAQSTFRQTNQTFDNFSQLDVIAHTHRQLYNYNIRIVQHSMLVKIYAVHAFIGCVCVWDSWEIRMTH